MNYKHPTVYHKSRKKIEIDLWIPKLNFGIEYHGEHHYHKVIKYLECKYWFMYSCGRNYKIQKQENLEIPRKWIYVDNMMSTWSLYPTFGMGMYLIWSSFIIIGIKFSLGLKFLFLGMIFQQVPDLMSSDKVRSKASSRFSEIVKNIQEEDLLSYDYHKPPLLIHNSLMLASEFIIDREFSYQNW